MTSTTWIKTTVVEPFPVSYGHVSFPTESRRETAVGPFYDSYVLHDLPEHRSFAEWRAAGLRENGWTVIVEEVRARKRDTESEVA